MKRTLALLITVGLIISGILSLGVLPSPALGEGFSSSGVSALEMTSPSITSNAAATYVGSATIGLTAAAGTYLNRGIPTSDTVSIYSVLDGGAVARAGFDQQVVNTTVFANGFGSSGVGHHRLEFWAVGAFTGETPHYTVTFTITGPPYAPTSLASSPWPKVGRDLRGTARSPYSGPRTDHLAWSYAGYFSTPQPPVVAGDGTVHVGGLAVNPDGTLKWSYAGVSGPSALASDGTVYVGADKLYALNPNGTLKWSYPLPGVDIVSSPPTIGSDGTIYLGSSWYSDGPSTYRGTLWAINPNGTLKWSYVANGTVGSCPVIGSDGTIYFTSQAQQFPAQPTTLFALNSDGTLKWTRAGVDGQPIIGGDGTIYGNRSGLCAINPADGSVRWTAGVTPSTDLALADDGTIHFGVVYHTDLLAPETPGRLYAFSPEGTLKWFYAMPRGVVCSPVVDGDGTVYVGNTSVFSGGDGSTRLYAINPAGTLKWFFSMAGTSASAPAIGSDGTVYVSGTSELYAIGPANPVTEGVAGADRYATAIEICQETFPTGSSTVIIATGQNFPDALSAAGIAGACDAPILLTPSTSLAPGLTAEIARLGATKAYVIGGTTAVSADVHGAVRAALSGSKEIERLAGANRYDTANAVAREAVAVLRQAGGRDWAGRAFLAVGTNYPDALVAGPIAFADGRVVLLTNSTLSAGTASLLSDTALGFTGVTVLGGGVTPAVRAAVSARVPIETVIAGADRYATATQFVDQVTGAGVAGWNELGIATGQNYPDALAAAPLLGRRNSVLLLTPGASLNVGVQSRLSVHKSKIGAVYILGGTNAVTQTVRDAVADALN